MTLRDRGNRPTVLTRLSEKVRLTRDVEGIRVPDGTRIRLPAGASVVIEQSLGGDFTVATECGDRVRIAGEDADALGRAPAPLAEAPVAGEFREEAVWEQLRRVYDPEIPVNIVDLGLVYGVAATPLPEGGHRVEVRMTLTAPGCGMGEVLKRDVERKLAALPGVRDVEVRIVFDPPWTRDRMSEAAKLELGFL